MNAYELSKLMLDVTDCESSEYYQAGMMLKQQADRIAELDKELKHYKMAWNMAENELEKQTKPLSDEEIIDCINKRFDLGLKAGHATVLAFARAIEERHGIK